MIFMTAFSCAFFLAAVFTDAGFMKLSFVFDGYFSMDKALVVGIGLYFGEVGHDYS